MARGKAIAVYAGLALLTVWPAVQMLLVQRYELSSWKLAGWGMYAEPRFAMLGMEVFGRADPAAPLEQLTAPSPQVADAATVFLERHRWLRRLARPDALVAAVRRDHPQWREVQVAVFRPRLNRETGMIEMTSVRYEYPAE